MPNLYSAPRISKVKKKGFTSEFLCDDCGKNFYIDDNQPGGLWRMHEYGVCPHCGGKDFWVT